LLLFFSDILYIEDIPGQEALLSWYPPIVKFELSGKNAGRWTETNETEFSVRHSRHAEGESINANGLRRGPLPTHKWQNGLRGASDVHHALLHINKEALFVIEGC
jgi:hypothetical protein